MKKLMIVMVVFGAAFVSCKSAKNIKSYSEIDSLAYAIGVDYGTHAKSMDSTMSSAVIAAAIADVLNNQPKMTRDEAYEFLNEYFMVRLPARQKVEAQAFFDDVKKKNPNVKVTDSGLMYEILDEGDMSRKATLPTDQVKVNYKGTLKDGTEFDKNDSISFPLNRVIPGWTEGMQLVGPGGKIILWVPAELGYGDRAQGNIPANSALVFDVDLLDVIPTEPAE